jgi:hypothetical protein
VEKYSRAGQAADINRVRRMLVACWIPKTTDIHSTTGYLLLFHSNSGNANAPPCYVIHTVHCPSCLNAFLGRKRIPLLVSATAVLSKVCLLNSVAVSKPSHPLRPAAGSDRLIQLFVNVLRDLLYR